MSLSTDQSKQLLNGKSCQNEKNGDGRMEINVESALDKRQGLGDWQPVRNDCSEAEDIDYKNNLSPRVLRDYIG